MGDVVWSRLDVLRGGPFDSAQGPVALRDRLCLRTGCALRPALFRDWLCSGIRVADESVLLGGWRDCNGASAAMRDSGNREQFGHGVRVRDGRVGPFDSAQGPTLLCAQGWAVPMDRSRSLAAFDLRQCLAPVAVHTIRGDASGQGVRGPSIVPGRASVRVVDPARVRPDTPR